MSDNYLRLIPIDPTWQPGPAAARHAVATLSALVPGAATIEVELYDEVTFIDPGVNFERVACPACSTELEMDWWSEQMGRAGEASFANLAVTTPCCRTRTSLNDLAYDWPAGFARAEVSVVNPPRGRLDDAELAQVAAGLGHPLRQVIAHY